MLASDSHLLIVGLAALVGLLGLCVLNTLASHIRHDIRRHNLIRDARIRRQEHLRMLRESQQEAG